jgi:hypothetical protein
MSGQCAAGPRSAQQTKSEPIAPNKQAMLTIDEGDQLVPADDHHKPTSPD